MNNRWIYILAILIALITMAPGTRPPKTPPATEPVKTQPVVTEPVETEPVQTEPVETEPVETEPVRTLPVVTEDTTAVPQRTVTPHSDQKDKFANASLPKSGYGPPEQQFLDPVAALCGVLGTAILLVVVIVLLAAIVSIWNRNYMRFRKAYVARIEAGDLALAALRQVEWIVKNYSVYGNNPTLVEECPWCGNIKSAGHAPECPRHLALRMEP